MLRGPIYCLAEGQGIVEFEISIRERYRKVVELYFKKIISYFLVFMKNKEAQIHRE